MDLFIDRNLENICATIRFCLHFLHKCDFNLNCKYYSCFILIYYTLQDFCMNTLNFYHILIYLFEILAATPIMELGPQNITVLDGKDATLNCRAAGAPTPNVTWIYNGKSLTVQIFYVWLLKLTYCCMFCNSGVEISENILKGVNTILDLIFH